ncbi:hypothetical protein PTKIN_Ptkin02bG0222700 [Pterospermum kingtungense]
MFGNIRRRYNGEFSPYLAMFAWLTYLMSDWVATVALSTLLRGRRNEVHNGLVVFWTPFFLWHLGGSYNITAYSLEDNEMWLRHLFGMVFQVGAAIYVYVKFAEFAKNPQHFLDLRYMACLIFLAGFFKYGERIWALRCASDKQLVNSLYSAPRSGPGLSGNMFRTGLYGDYKWPIESATNGRLGFLRQAYSAFEVFKPLFSDVPFELPEKFRKDMAVYLKDRSSEEDAFRMVGIELEILYDMLFTKLPIQHGSNYVASLAIRLFSFWTSYCFGSFFIFFRSFQSIWVAMEFPGYKFYSMPFTPKRDLNVGTIKVMAQHDLIDYIVRQGRKHWLSDVINVIDTNHLVQKYWYTTWQPFDLDLKKFIYSHLKAKHEECDKGNFEFDFVSKLLEKKGNGMIEKWFHDDDDWKIEATDFTSRIFIWHFATELVYYDDLDNFRSPGSWCKRAKALSDYMMYLVLVRPLMLPKGFNELVNELAYDQADKFFRQENLRNKDPSVASKRFARGLLSHESDELLEIYGVTSNRIDDVLFQGRKFAKQLQDLVKNHRWDDENKWEFISDVWMEMLIYAASHCSWKEHAQELRHGGELLTHVALLMAHFGLSTQIQKQKSSQADHDMQFDNPPFAI